MNRTFLTGCDSNTEWQLPWFIRNFIEYNEDEHLLVSDFGMSNEMLAFLNSLDYNISVVKVLTEAEGWFKKPRAMLDASFHYDKVCWLDTDCQIMRDISDIFDHTVPFKLSMVEDRPWTKRRGEMGTWHNTGVVVYEGTPNTLKVWADACINDPIQGDQETLYAMCGGDEILKMSIIEPLPHKYNTLRLDYIDGIAVKDPWVIHHTGKKGKDVIREQMEMKDVE